MKKIIGFFIALFLLSGSLIAGGQNESNSDMYSIGVFVPGQIEGSPTYELLVQGVQDAADEARTQGHQVQVNILEAGYNQAEWGDKLRSYVATGSFDLIVSSNPSIPDLVLAFNDIFPGQQYLVMDAENPGLDNMSSVMLNQYEQAYLSGYFAGLVTLSDELPGSNDQKVAGLLAGQEYPVMDNDIRPGFTDGFLAAAGGDATVEFRVLGNWYDAENARELADSMIRQGSDVILTIAGSGSQGVIAAARAAGNYVLWYDSPGYEYAPGTVLGSSMVLIDELTFQSVEHAINGNLEYGTTSYVGIREGAVDYARDYSEYRQFVPMSIQNEMNSLIQSILDGELILSK